MQLPQICPRAIGRFCQEWEHTPLKMLALLSPMSSPRAEEAVRMVLATKIPPGFRTRLISAICADKSPFEV